MTTELLQQMARECIHELGSCHTFTQQAEQAGYWHGPITHAITELRTGVSQQESRMRSIYSDRDLSPRQIDRVRMYHATQGAVLKEVPTSAAALIAWLREHILLELVATAAD